MTFLLVSSFKISVLRNGSTAKSVVGAILGLNLCSSL